MPETRAWLLSGTAIPPVAATAKNCPTEAKDLSAPGSAQATWTAVVEPSSCYRGPIP
jgi:hypothetical protein